MKNPRFNSILRRCCALALCAALAFPPHAGAAWGSTRLETSHEILDGLTYTDTVSQYDAGRLASFTLELEKGGNVHPILMQSSGTVYGSATINAAVKLAQEMGYQVMAAVNTDYFSTATGVPQGIVIEDGFIYLPDGQVLSYTDSMQVKATAYSHLDAGCDMITATGTTVHHGTVAVDPRLIPLGTRMFIVTNDGEYVYGISTAEDTGSSIKEHRVDLYFPTKALCFQFGVRSATVYFLG